MNMNSVWNKANGRVFPVPGRAQARYEAQRFVVCSTSAKTEQWPFKEEDELKLPVPQGVRPSGITQLKKIKIDRNNRFGGFEVSR